MVALKNVDLIIKNAHELITCKGPVDGVNGSDLDSLECIQSGALAVDAGRIVAVGKSSTITEQYSGRQVIDCTGCLVSPGLVDPHTHLIYAGSRHEEYESKVQKLESELRDLELQRDDLKRKYSGESIAPHLQPIVVMA